MWSGLLTLLHTHTHTYRLYVHVRKPYTYHIGEHIIKEKTGQLSKQPI